MKVANLSQNCRTVESRIGIWRFEFLAGLFVACVLQAYMVKPVAKAQTSVPSSISADTTWIAADSPYVVSQDVTVEQGVTLTVEPAVVVKFGDCDSLYVKGDLVANGASGGQIVFTSLKDDSDGHDTNGDGNASTPAARDWGGLCFSDTCTDSLLDHVVVRYGGREWSSPLWQSVPAISVRTSNLVVCDSTISDNGTDGVWVYQCNPRIQNNVVTNNGHDGIEVSSASPTIEGNIISDNGQTSQGHGITVGASSNPQILGNTIEDNTGWAICVAPSSSGTNIQNNNLFGPQAGILVKAGDVDGDTVWNSDSVYVIDYYRDASTMHLTIGEEATLTVESGVVLKFEKNAQLKVYGDLIAQGTPGENIVFTSLKDDSSGGDTNGDGSFTTPAKNDWGNLCFIEAFTGSMLDHAAIRYAGQTWSSPMNVSLPAIQIGPSCGSNVEISKCTISDNGHGGMYVGGAAPTITENVISNNTDEGLYLHSAAGEITRNTVTGNDVGVYDRGGMQGAMYLNDFLNNTTNAKGDHGHWYKPFYYEYQDNAYSGNLGNYWSDYAGSDSDGDGVGDTPYVSDGAEDPYPLTRSFQGYTLLEEPPQPQRVKGIDVSAYQEGNIDWSEVKDDSYIFAFRKATEGEGWSGDSEAYNDYFEEDMGNAHDTEFLIGPYHFGLPQLGNSPSEEASWFLKVIKDAVHMGDLRPAFDLEDHEHTGTFPSKLNEGYPSTLTEWVLTWMHIVEDATGVEPMLYTTGSYIKNDLDVDITPFGKSITDYDLWIAHPTCEAVGEPPIGDWDDWAFWQYYDPDPCGDNVGDNAVQGVDGNEGNVDLNVFNGDSSELGMYKISLWTCNPVQFLVFKLFCPVDMVVTDPDGRVINKQENEIPEAVFFEYDMNGDGESDQMIDVFRRKVGDYQVTLVPKRTASPDDTFGLTVTTQEGAVTLAQEVPIQDIPSEPYIIKASNDGIVPIFPATADFDPDTLNLIAPRKFVTVYIGLPGGFGVDEIDLATVVLNDSISALAHPTEIADHDGDGKPDLMVKFDGQAVCQSLAVGEQTIRVSGCLTDGTLFAGMDTIRVIDRP